MQILIDYSKLRDKCEELVPDNDFEVYCKLKVVVNELMTQAVQEALKPFRELLPALLNEPIKFDYKC